MKAMGKGAFTAASTGAASVSDASRNKTLALSSPNSAITQFQKAAQIIEQKYPGALSAFRQYVEKGASANLDLQSQALIQSLPVSTTAMDTMNELRGYLGMAPISPTAGLPTSIDNSINKLMNGPLANSPQAASVAQQLMGLRDQFTEAEGLQDTAAREAMKAQLLGSVDSLKRTLGPGMESIASDLTNVQGKFDAGYGSDALKPPSAADIQAKLEANPAYQFNLSQGLKAIDRSAAAKGNLLSGNTLAAAGQYASGLASNEYNNQVNRLSGLLSQSLPAIYAQQGLLSGMGQSLNQTGQMIGAAAGDVNRSIADAGQQSANTQGQALLQTGQLQSQMSNQTDLANAQMRQQALLTNAQMQQDAAKTSAAAGANTDPNQVLANAQLLKQVQNTLSPDTSTTRLPYNGGSYSSGLLTR